MSGDTIQGLAAGYLLGLVSVWVVAYLITRGRS